MISCKLEECLHDCDLKSWFSWTECTEDTATKNLTQKRTRLFPRAGISKFTTKSCPEEELRSCELPTTSVFENLTTSIITAEISKPLG
uniref:Uncharacterized protein n=1 Tax=Romanomermis culicivorax TaxID=13658 RepID=A0A915JWD2_ROMCU